MTHLHQHTHFYPGDTPNTINTLVSMGSNIDLPLS